MAIDVKTHPYEQAAQAGRKPFKVADLSLAEFLSVTAEDGDPYLHVDELAATLNDARTRAAGVLPGRRR